MPLQQVICRRVMNDSIPPNPFATASIHPANCKFVLPADSNELEVQKYLKPLADRFVRCGSLGQIVGPHGCGKSTLAIALSKCLLDRFASALTVTIRDRTQTGNSAGYWYWPVALSVQSEPVFEQMRSPGVRRTTLIILDGCENLSKLNQRLLVHSLIRSSQSNRSFLLTTHRPIKGVSVIATLQPQFQQFLKIVDSLQRNSELPVSSKEITEVWSNCNGNYRIGLRSLYDLSSERVSKAASADRPGINTAASDVGREVNN